MGSDVEKMDGNRATERERKREQYEPQGIRNVKPERRLADQY
jgi:hypothetical protein